MLKLLPSKVLLASSSLLLLSPSAVNAEVSSFEATRLMSSSRADVGTQTMQDVSPQAQVNRELVDTGVQPDNDVRKILNSVDDVDIDAENGDEIEPVDVGVRTDDLENDNPSDKDLLDEIVKLQDSDSGRIDTDKIPETRSRRLGRAAKSVAKFCVREGLISFAAITLYQAIKSGDVKKFFSIGKSNIVYILQYLNKFFLRSDKNVAPKRQDSKAVWF